MEKFKIKNFKKDNPKLKFPEFFTLSSMVADGLYLRLIVKLGYGELPREMLLDLIEEKGEYIEFGNANDDDFSLKKVFLDNGITPHEHIYINWYHFDDIDKIRFVDLDQHFDYIWYPASDEIDIFDQSFSWIISVAHYGSIKLLRL